MKTFKTLLAVVFCTGSAFAHSNLITNGGFEEPAINSGWTFGHDPSGGWLGDHIEVWASGFLGVDSYEGEGHAELNAHPYHSDEWRIYQTFDTVLGNLYEVSFAYRARQSHSESFLFEIFDDESSQTIVETMDSHVRGTWNYYSDTFRGTGEKTTIQFTSITPEQGTLGNFLDAVSVTQVPVPGVPALLCAGLIGLQLSRRRYPLGS